MARTTHARGPHVHAAVAARGQLSSIADDEPTKRVPAELIALATSLHDDDETDPCTPLSGIAFKALDDLAALTDGEVANEVLSRASSSRMSPSALDALETDELEGAFRSIDSLGVQSAAAIESTPPASIEAGAVHRSGVVPALNPLAIVKRKSEVIPPPPKRPTAVVPLPLDATTPAAPPLARPITKPMLVPTTSPSPVRPSLTLSTSLLVDDDEQDESEAEPEARVVAVTSRQTISRSAASAVFALFALMLLVMTGTQPDPVVLPIARTVVTINARAPMSAPRRTAARASYAAPRPAAVAAAPVQLTPPARGPIATAPRSLASNPRIVRTAPF